MNVIFVDFRELDTLGEITVLGIAAIALYAMTHSAAAARQLVRVSPRVLIGSWLLLALSSGVAPLFFGRRFLTGMWTTITTYSLGELHIGTALLFDLGVFCVVTGVTPVFVFSLLEE